MERQRHGHGRDYAQWPEFERKDRNAKTVDTFKKWNETFPIGVGVSLIKKPEPLGN